MRYGVRRGGGYPRAATPPRGKCLQVAVAASRPHLIEGEQVALGDRVSFDLGEAMRAAIAPARRRRVIHTVSVLTLGGAPERLAHDGDPSPSLCPRLVSVAIAHDSAAFPDRISPLPASYRDPSQSPSSDGTPPSHVAPASRASRSGSHARQAPTSSACALVGLARRTRRVRRTGLAAAVTYGSALAARGRAARLRWTIAPCPLSPPAAFSLCVSRALLERVSPRHGSRLRMTEPTPSGCASFASRPACARAGRMFHVVPSGARAVPRRRVHRPLLVSCMRDLWLGTSPERFFRGSPDAACSATHLRSRLERTQPAGPATAFALSATSSGSNAAGPSWSPRWVAGGTAGTLGVFGAKPCLR